MSGHVYCTSDDVISCRLCESEERELAEHIETCQALVNIGTGVLIAHLIGAIVERQAVIADATFNSRAGVFRAIDLRRDLMRLADITREAQP